MYPKIFLEYFRDFERTNRVFVAMPFSPDFKPRWDDVFRPAIEAVGLEAFRVDMRKTGDSIQTEILQQISQAQLILVDVSTDETGHRNANVMYELGVAHASRLPDEVIIVRSDRSDEGNLPFDFSQIRVTWFNPNDKKKAQNTMVGLLDSALKEVKLTKDLILDNVISKLDANSLYIVAQERSKNEFEPYTSIAGRYGHIEFWEVRQKLDKLLDLGLIRVSNSSDKYVWTLLGKTIIEKLKDKLDTVLTSPLWSR